MGQLAPQPDATRQCAFDPRFWVQFSSSARTYRNWILVRLYWTKILQVPYGVALAKSTSRLNGCGSAKPVQVSSADVAVDAIPL